MISLKQINYALAVEHNLHFKKAAEACAISQSALSSALTEMEKQLGFQVFERDNKKVLVTPQGRQVLDKAREIKLLMDDLLKISQVQQNPLSSNMSMGIIPTIEPYLLPLVLPALQQQYPQLELTVFEEQSHKLVDQVRSGDIDTAILALPYKHDGLLSFKFWQEDFYWITHADDEKAGLEKISASQIDTQKLMLLKEGHCLKDHALAACKLSDIASRNLRASGLSTLVQLAAGGMGSTLVPEMALAQLVDNNPKLAKVPLAEAGPHRELAFIVRPNYPALNNIEQLIALFQQQMLAMKNI